MKVAQSDQSENLFTSQTDQNALSQTKKKKSPTQTLKIDKISPSKNGSKNDDGGLKIDQNPNLTDSASPQKLKLFSKKLKFKG